MIYSVSVICIILSIFIVFCILKTQERKYKNVAHISWVSAFIMMIVGSLSACFFTLLSLLTDKHCEILDYTENNKSVDGIPLFYPTGTVSLLNTCLFGEQKSASIDLGLKSQVEAITNLKASCTTFLNASEDTDWNDSAWTSYQTNQLDKWLQRPSLMTLVSTDTRTLIQPNQQLKRINEKTDIFVTSR